MSLATHEQAAIDSLFSAMLAEGIETNDQLKLDGTLERFHVTGDRVGSRNGWLCAHIDEYPAAQFGCYKRLGDTRLSWKADRASKPMTDADRRALKRRMETQRVAKAEAERKRHADAAVRAQAVWDSAREATDDHPYLKRKGVKAHGLRVGPWEFANEETGEVFKLTDNALLVPITDKKRKIQSLQAIFPSKILGKGDGARDKDFLKGGAKLGLFHAIGRPQMVNGRPVMVVCEGFATGASIHEATGHLVLVTFDTSNLLPVADAIRESKPDSLIVVAADNDRWTTTPIANPGKHFAARAALASNGVVAMAEFIDLTGEPTDFNDLHQREGAQAVVAIISKAVAKAAGRMAAVAALENSSAAIDDTPPAYLVEGPSPIESASQCDVASPGTVRDEERRRQQQEENERLQENQLGVMFPSKMELGDMIQNLVWIAEGEQVAHVSPNRTMFLTFKEMRSLTAESTTYEPSEGMKKPVPNAVLWQRDAQRRNAMTRTFHAGTGIICADPEGKMAVNTWRPMRRWEGTADIGLFLEHVEYLFADQIEREVFLDWLAHLEQKPGELPHYGWLHVANHTGCGRNWLASVLARVWRGYVAPNVDLPSLLDSSYNGCLSGRVLAIVDEVQEGAGENSYRHTNKLRSLVNAEYRDINPKFGRQYREHNACRWLVFSNHLNALPIGDTDRRWRVMVHDAAPRSPETYAKLYAALNDPEFINAVAIFLKARDISEFKPGERPPMNNAKLSVVGASKSLTQQRADEIVENWPADIISNADAAVVMSEGLATNINASMRRSLEEIGAINIGRQIKIGGKGQRVWIIRNHAQWAEQDNATIVVEQQKARLGLHMDADAMFVLAENRLGQHVENDDHPFD